jgi:hypothetical protein
LPTIEIIILEDITYHSYHLEFNSKVDNKTGYALVDREASGNFCSDAIILEKTGNIVNFVGIDSHEIKDATLLTVTGYKYIQNGFVLIIIHQCVCFGQGKTISSIKIEHYQNTY